MSNDLAKGCCRSLLVAVALIGLIDAAPVQAEEVTVQVTAFQVPELTLGLESWNQTQNDDAELYRRLVRLAGQGEAEVILDHRVTTQSRARVLSEARSEYIYPTEFDNLGNLLHTPTAFESRYLGTRIEGEATTDAASTGQPARWIDCFLAAKRVRLKGLLPLEFPNLGGSGPRTGTLGLPVFMTEELSPAVTLLNGRPMMIGLTRPADHYDEQPAGAGQAVIVTFARASTVGAAAAEAMAATESDPSPIRMHALTVRVPLLATAQRIWQRNEESDEAMRQAFLDLVRTGIGKIVSHAGVITNSGQRGNVQSITELIYPTEYDRLLPTAFETRNVGVDWEVEVTGQVGTDALAGSADLSATRPPIWRAIPIGPGSTPPALEVPDFLSSRWSTPLSMTIGETCFVAAVTPPAEDDDADAASSSWLDVSFLKSIPPGKGDASRDRAPKGKSRRTSACLALFSVTEETTVSLNAGTPAAASNPDQVTATVDGLWTATATGDARLVSFARILQRELLRSRVEGVREWIYPTEWTAAKGETNAACFTACETELSGTRLEVEVLPSDGEEAGEIVVDFSQEIAPPTFLTFEEIQAVREAAREDYPDSPPPTFYNFSVNRETHYTSGVPQILAIEKSPAPTGHPEHGRWLVAVLKVTPES